MSIIEIKNNYAKKLGYQDFEHLICVSNPSIINNHIDNVMDLAVLEWDKYIKTFK